MSVVAKKETVCRFGDKFADVWNHCDAPHLLGQLSAA